MGGVWRSNEWEGPKGKERETKDIKCKAINHPFGPALGQVQVREIETINIGSNLTN
jgi:hypothetical protein